jgi:pimeloyl-ACP methyl ester carboxylesterase
MTLLDTPQISGAYFFPRFDELSAAHVVAVEGAELHCHRHQVNDDALTLIHFHGNGETVGDYVKRGAGAGFFDLGVNVVFAEYRGYGGSTGSPALVSQLADCEAVLDSLHIPDDRAVAFGRSIGSLYAVELCARRPNLGGLILESGIADPAERFLTYADLASLGVDESTVQAEARKYFDHEAKLRQYANPLLILHAADDALIDFDHAERNFRWAGASSQKKALCRFESGGHNAIMSVNYATYFAEVQALLDLVG